MPRKISKFQETKEQAIEYIKNLSLSNLVMEQVAIDAVNSIQESSTHKIKDEKIYHLETECNNLTCDVEVLKKELELTKKALDASESAHNYKNNIITYLEERLSEC